LDNWDNDFFGTIARRMGNRVLALKYSSGGQASTRRSKGFPSSTDLLQQLLSMSICRFQVANKIDFLYKLDLYSAALRPLVFIVLTIRGCMSDKT
jgi:hypothetical protein